MGTAMAQPGNLTMEGGRQWAVLLWDLRQEWRGCWGVAGWDLYLVPVVGPGPSLGRKGGQCALAACYVGACPEPHRGSF